MKCKRVKLLLAPYILGDLADDLKLPDQLEAHLRTCNCCTGEYQSVKQTMEFIEEYRDIFAEAFVEIDLERAKKKDAPKPTWEKISAESMEKPKSLRRFLRIGAVAACLAIGVFTWLVFSNYSKPQNIPQASSSKQIASALRSSVQVELVTNTGNIPLQSDQQITSASQLIILLINGRHRLVMNTNTVLAIEPMVTNSLFGCKVQLCSGQIYTHVQHDGNPFIVDTAHGQAVITGTTFDIKATEDSTTLVVSEGTVRFESEKGVVNVAAGQKSKIIWQSAPSIPLSCNTAELTAWATGYKPNTALAQAGSDDDDWYLAFSLRKAPIVLAETDYHQWVEEKRQWFKKDFPWIFELKDALVREGIEVDYPELLIRSGYVWQFVCLERFPARFSVPDFESLLKTATSYGFDREWLLKNMPIARIIQDKCFLLQNPTGLAAFEQLLKYVNGTQATPYCLYPADACKYLAETRSLIWFAVRHGEHSLANEERAEVLDLLQQEVTTATNCSNDLWYPKYEKKKLLCDENLCETLETKIIRYIEKVILAEEKIVKYGICL